LDAADKTRATLVAVGSNFAGLAVGPLISGFLAEYGPRQLQLPFLIYIGVVAIVAVLIARSPETVNPRATTTPSRTSVAMPRSIRAAFIAPAVTAFTVFSLIFTRRLASRTCMRLALALLVPALALLIAAQAQGSLSLLLVGTAGCTRHVRTAARSPYSLIRATRPRLLRCVNPATRHAIEASHKCC
jgi:MFS family permease